MSQATTLVLILAAQQISYENALALAIGSNVGSTITAVIGTLGSRAVERISISEKSAEGFEPRKKLAEGRIKGSDRRVGERGTNSETNY